MAWRLLLGCCPDSSPLVDAMFVETGELMHRRHEPLHSDRARPRSGVNVLSVFLIDYPTQHLIIVGFFEKRENRSCPYLPEPGKWSSRLRMGKIQMASADWR
ncbi:hypothetical protein E4U37_003824 [Claviceps purpurea]|nr:hypothetical protein E4U37_003824 [Claviceps purpurea]